jgi:hypothetical protein
MDGTESEDIRRVLAICFRGVSELDALDIERILSLDMGWLKPDEAIGAVQSLIKAGWLTGAQESLSPVEDFSSSSTPLGWFPRPQRLLNPNPFSRNDVKPEEADKERPLPQSEEKKSAPVPKLKQETNDPRAGTTRRLLKYIARASGLETEEVQRRATRKQRALVHVTGWMALALVARDQGLDMDSVIQALS